MNWRICVPVFRYASQKFLNCIAWIIFCITFTFGALQVKFIQNAIINCFINADFEKIDGAFPFKFSIKKLKINLDSCKIEVDNFSLAIDPILSGIKQVNVNTCNIRTERKNTNGKINIKQYIPLFYQTLAKNVNVDTIIYNGQNIGQLNITSINNSQNIFFKTSEKKIIHAVIKINGDDNVFLNVKYDCDKNIEALYNIKTSKFLCSLSSEKKQNKIFETSGLFKDDKIIGEIRIQDTVDNMKFSIFLRDNFINMQCEVEQYKTSLNATYNTNTEQILVENLKIGELVKIQPFCITKDHNIDEVKISLPKSGEIKINNINLSSKDFNLGKWKFKNIDISALQKPDNGEILHGIINGNSDFKNSSENFDIKIKNISYGNFKNPEINIKGIYAKDQIRAKIAYEMVKKKNLIDVIFSAKNWIINKQSALKVKANGNLDIENILTQTTGHAAAGNIQYKLNILGTLEKPEYNGSFNLKDGIYVNSAMGTYLKKGTVSASIKNKQIIFEKISAIDDLKNHGTISGTGNIIYKNKEPFLNINMNINSLEVVDIPELYGKLFGKINISGNIAKEIKITGDLYTNNAKFDVSKFIVMSTYGIDIVDSIKQKAPPSEKKEINLNCKLDVNFTLKPDLTIVGYGINSKWHGGAKIYGDLNNVKYDGSITLDNGTINVTNKKFKLENGKISVSDKFPGTIFVNISAVKSIDKMKVWVSFTQDQKGTDVRFLSKPYTSKRDILSYMLFEKQSSEISTGEAITLFNIMNKLSGEGDLDILENIKTVFNLDTIEIKRNNDDTRGPYNSVSVGTSIGKLKISIDQGASTDTTKVVVDAKVAKNTKVSVDLSGTNNAGAGIFWNKRF